MLKNLLDILIDFYFGSTLTIERRNPSQTASFYKAGTMLWILLELQGHRPNAKENEVVNRVRNNRFLVKLSASPKFRVFAHESKSRSLISNGQNNNSAAETKINFRKLFDLKGATKDETHFSAEARVSRLGLLKANEVEIALEKSQFDGDNYSDKVVGDIDQVLNTSHLQDFTSLVSQSNTSTRTFRFWENNVHSAQNSVRISLDWLLFIDKSKNKQVLEYAQSFETYPTTLERTISARELVRDLISLTFHKKADFFALNTDGSVSFRIQQYQVDNLSNVLVRHQMAVTGPKIARFQRFFELRDNLRADCSIGNLFERNFMLNFVGLFDEYLSFHMIALSECQMILDLIRKLDLLFKQTEQVVNFFETFEQNRTHFNLLDFISILQRNLSQLDNVRELIEESFSMSIFPLLKTVYQVAFKNSPVDLLTKYLRITYEQDHDFNYKASNVPGLLEKAVANILITKNNYLLLSSADSELFLRSVRADLPWFESLDIREIQKVYQDLRARLLAQQTELNEAINKRMVA